MGKSPRSRYRHHRHAPSHAERVAVMNDLANHKISKKEAAGQLGLSIRQISRLKLRYCKDGPDGLLHGLAGARSNRRYNRALRTEVLRLFEECYSDYGPTLLAETLERHHSICVSNEWVRKLLIEKHLWHKARKHRRHRKKRPRRDQQGALVQFDGSDHLWFEHRARRCTLLLAIDDASDRIMASLALEEDTSSVLTFWCDYVSTWGIPRAVYTDFGAVYHNNQHSETLTDFGRAMQQLGIEHIKAHSPQAKGRVERAFRTFQDRLVKELRRLDIRDLPEANRFLKETFLPEWNQRQKTKHSEGRHTACKDVHRRCLLGKEDLKNIFCFQEERHLYNDYTIRLSNRWYQLEPGQIPLPRPRSRIIVRRWLDGSLHLFADTGSNQELSFHEFSPQAAGPKKIQLRPVVVNIPAKDHPWRTKPLNRKGARRLSTRKTKRR